MSTTNDDFINKLADKIAERLAEAIANKIADEYLSTSNGLTGLVTAQVRKKLAEKFDVSTGELAKAAERPKTCLDDMSEEEAASMERQVFERVNKRQHEAFERARANSKDPNVMG